MRFRHSVLVFVFALLPAGIVLAGSSKEATSPIAKLYNDFLIWEAGEWDATIRIMKADGSGMNHFVGEQIDRLGACGSWLLTDLTMLPSKPGEEVPPYAGHGVLGFDPAKEKFVGLWVAPPTNWLATAEGTLTADGRTLMLYVDARHPVTGEPMKRLFKTTKKSEGHKHLEISIPDGSGGQLTIAEIDYKRRSK